MDIKRINSPLTKDVIRTLKAGDEVLITGIIYTARDIAHQRICDSIAKSEQLPLNLDGAIIYFVGPSPAREPRAIGSAGPTTSSRMDSFSPILLDNGLAAMIGRGIDANYLEILCRRIQEFILRLLAERELCLVKQLSLQKL